MQESQTTKANAHKFLNTKLPKTGKGKGAAQQ